MNGSCLCGTIEFELTHKPAVFYRCHCSLCRKQSGVGYNLATLVKDSEFRWIKGENCIASWSRGLRSNGTETYDNGINMLYLKCFYLGLTLSGTKTYVKV